MVIIVIENIWYCIKFIRHFSFHYWSSLSLRNFLCLKICDLSNTISCSNDRMLLFHLYWVWAKLYPTICVRCKTSLSQLTRLTVLKHYRVKTLISCNILVSVVPRGNIEIGKLRLNFVVSVDFCAIHISGKQNGEKYNII